MPEGFNIIQPQTLRELWKIELEQRAIWMCDDIDPVSATATDMALRLLAERGKEPISLYLHTSGGFMDDAWSIVDSIRACRRWVIGRAQGQVASAGVIVLAACDFRVSTPHTLFTVHSSHGQTSGDILEIREYLGRLLNYNQMMAEFLGQRTKRKARWWKGLQEESCDQYLTAKEALKVGLVEFVEKV